MSARSASKVRWSDAKYVSYSATTSCTGREKRNELDTPLGRKGRADRDWAGGGHRLDERHAVLDEGIVQGIELLDIEALQFLGVALGGTCGSTARRQDRQPTGR